MVRRKSIGLFVFVDSQSGDIPTKNSCFPAMEGGILVVGGGGAVGVEGGTVSLPKAQEFMVLGFQSTHVARLYGGANVVQRNAHTNVPKRHMV
ncbi:hypothetical protein LguiA_024692 [Lonicera macranthoides]